MNRRKFMMASAAALALGTGAYAACDVQTDDTADRDGKLTIEVYASSDYPMRANPDLRPTSLLVDFADVSVHHTMNGWIDIEGGGIFDLLDANPHMQRIFGHAPLPDGMYDQIRFEVRVALVEVDGKWYPVDVPSGDTSGFKVHTNFCMVRGDPENLQLEIDVDESLHYNKARGYWLEPSIDVFSPLSCTDDFVANPKGPPHKPWPV